MSENQVDKYLGKGYIRRSDIEFAKLDQFGRAPPKLESNFGQTRLPKLDSRSSLVSILFFIN